MDILKVCVLFFSLIATCLAYGSRDELRTGAEAPNLSKMTCSTTDEPQNVTLDKIYWLLSPSASESETSCEMNFKVPASSSSQAMVLDCDVFDFGKIGEDFHCEDEYLYVKTDDEEVKLCGLKTGLHMELPVKNTDSPVLVGIHLASQNESYGNFSCLIFSEPQMEDVAFDSSCQCGIANGPENKSELFFDRIIGGEAADANKYPWQVALVKTGLYKPFCGGSLITDKHVLTAAHCTGSVMSPELEVLLGEHDLTTSYDVTVRMKVFRIIEHPLYNDKTAANDFAILTLAEQVRFTKYIRPVCLPMLNPKMAHDDFTNQVVTVSGWGFQTLKFRPGIDPRPGSLKETDLVVMSNEDCQKRWDTKVDNSTTNEDSVQILPAMICAKPIDPKSSACFGDSGGPLMLLHQDRFVQVGIVSFGPEMCIDRVVPNVYARITDALHWILYYVKKQRMCLPKAPVQLPEAF